LTIKQDYINATPDHHHHILFNQKQHLAQPSGMSSSVTNVFETGKYTTQLQMVGSSSYTQYGTNLINFSIISKSL